MATSILTTAKSDPSAGAQVLRFGRFCLVPGSRTLLRDGAPVELGGRAFDLLHVLVRSRGQVVSKAAIIAQVWPHAVVEESNLRFQMATLRRALADDRGLILTVPGRGYLFASHPSDAEVAQPSASIIERAGLEAEAFANEGVGRTGALGDLIQSLLGELQRLSSRGELDGGRVGSTAHPARVMAS